MPEWEIRVMGPIAEVGELPQSEQYGATSTRSTKSENTSESDKQSQFYVTGPTISLPKAGGVFRGIDETININLSTSIASSCIASAVGLGG